MTIGSMGAVEGISRVDPELDGSEIEVSTQFLDYHRATLRTKCAGLSDDQLKVRAVATVDPLPAGAGAPPDGGGAQLVRAAGRPAGPPGHDEDTDPDGDFDNLDRRRSRRSGPAYEEAVAGSARSSRATPTAATARGGPGRPRNVRWVLVHMIEEYARHNGHADLLRESIDGRSGE